MGRAAIEGWIHRSRAAPLALAGQDFDALKSAAVKRGFRPVPLGVTATVALRNTIRGRSIAQHRRELDGQRPDPEDEYVIYMAHWDHLGLDELREGRPHLQRRRWTMRADARASSRSRARSRPATGRRSARSCSSPSPRRSRACSVREYYVAHPLYPLTKTARQHQHRRRSTCGARPATWWSSASARHLDDTSACATEQGRDLGPTRSRKRASTTAPITSTSPRPACRRSIPMLRWTTSASRRARQEEGESTRRRTITSPPTR